MLREIMEQLLSVLYGVSGFAAAGLYVPQILKYHRDSQARLSISLVSWTGWLAIAAITVVYALYVVKSYLIAMVASLNAIAQIIVLSYGLQARLSHRATAIIRKQTLP